MTELELTAFKRILCKMLQEIAQYDDDQKAEAEKHQGEGSLSTNTDHRIPAAS